MQLPGIALPAPIVDPGWPPSESSTHTHTAVTGHVIDWSWQRAVDAEREILIRWAARLQSRGFGFDLGWGAEVLKNASAQVTHPIIALMEDEHGTLNLVEAKGGKLTVHTDVSEADPVVKRLADADAAELMPVAIGASQYAAAGIASVELAHYFPEWLLDELEELARKTDRSLSYTMQRAWKLGGPLVCADPEAAGKAVREAAPVQDGPARRRKQTLTFPIEILAQLDAEAARQDRSRSWLLNAAWVLARARLAHRDD